MAKIHCMYWVFRDAAIPDWPTGHLFVSGKAHGICYNYMAVTGGDSHTLGPAYLVHPEGRLVPIQERHAGGSRPLNPKNLLCYSAMNHRGLLGGRENSCGHMGGLRRGLRDRPRSKHVSLGRSSRKDNCTPAIIREGVAQQIVRG
jgi:hypothetical protein